MSRTTINTINRDYLPILERRMKQKQQEQEVSIVKLLGTAVGGVAAILGLAFIVVFTLAQ